jgi:hypothetical protein
VDEVTVTVSRDVARGVLTALGIVIELLNQPPAVAEERRAGMARLRSAEMDAYGLTEARDAFQMALSA